MRRALQQRLPVAAGTALTVFLAAGILLPKTTSEVLRDSAFDIELAGDQWLRRPAPSDLKVIVVDIDRTSIDTLGTWPWETMARLVEAVATGRHPDATPAWHLQRYSRDLGQRPGASSSR
jgi:adenylate cyclase